MEEAKGRLATQLEEHSRLEDKIRALSIELATEQAQVEKLHHDVSFCPFFFFFGNLCEWRNIPQYVHVWSQQV